MILTLLVAVDLLRTCYRTLYMVSFDIQFNHDPPQRFNDIKSPSKKTIFGQITFFLYLIFLMINLLQFIMYEVFFYMILL